MRHLLIPLLILMAGCQSGDPYYHLYTFDDRCYQQYTPKIDTCQPCSYFGPARQGDAVVYTDSATGDSVPVEIGTRPLFTDYGQHHYTWLHSWGNEEQVQKCTLEARIPGNPAHQLRLVAEAKEDRLNVEWDNTRRALPRRNFRYSAMLIPPLEDSSGVLDATPANAPLALLWLSPGLGIIRIRYHLPDGSIRTLIKRHGL